MVEKIKYLNFGTNSSPLPQASYIDSKYYQGELSEYENLS